MLVGYMRVSSDTDRPTTDLQRDALLEAAWIRASSLRIRRVGHAMIDPASSRRWPMSNRAIVWWSGNWTGSAARRVGRGSVSLQAVLPLGSSRKDLI